MSRHVTDTLARVFRTPPYLILFVNDTCRLKCRHCWYTDAWKGKHLCGPPLSFRELERLADSIGTLYFLSLTGGEAFLREDIVELVEMLVRKTNLKRYEIPTSGFEPDVIVPSTERMLRMNPGVPFRVDVSLDGTEETHDRIRNTTGSYRRALRTIRELRALGDRHPRFDVGVITTISSFNQHEVSAIADIVESANPLGEWMVNVARGETRDPRAVEVDCGNYIAAGRIIDRRVREKRWGGHRGHFTGPWLSAKNATRRKVIADVLARGRFPGRCAAGSLGGVIFNDGTVRPCELLDRSFGNVRDFDYELPRLWNSPAGDEIRGWIREQRCMCTQECFLSVSLLLQPRHWFDIVRERIKRLGSASAERARGEK
jgi:MoaA/NifB/PqqE/SkfB family radical SAM enzyme